MRVSFPGLYIALGLVLAGLIHVVAVLTLPMLAPKDAEARLAALGPTNTMIQLPAAVPGRQVMPLMAPDVRYAICHFDLSNGPVRLRARLADDYWLIGMYTPLGENFYAVASGDLKRREVDLVIATAEQTVDDAGVDAPESYEDLVVVNSPVVEGIAMIRAPLAGPSHGERAERELQATSCSPYHKSS